MSTARQWPPEADTVITDPETGPPVITESLDIDHAPACRGWCNQGRQPCKTPHACRTGTRLHRVIEVMSHPTDEVLRSRTLDELDEDTGLRWLLLACAVIATAIFLFAWHVASLPVVPQ